VKPPTEPRRLSIADIKGTVDRRDVHPVDWPGVEGRKVGLMELRCSEIQAAYFAARDRFARKGLATIDEAARDAFDEELEVQYCYLMLVDPEARAAKFRMFKTADECRDRLDPDERGFFRVQAAKLQAEKVRGWRLPSAVDEIRAELAAATERLAELGDTETAARVSAALEGWEGEPA
jgi:hypothetical protein